MEAKVLGSSHGTKKVGAGLYSIGIPKDSVLKYESALKSDKFLIIAHGTAESVASARSILENTGAAEVAVHSEMPGAAAA